VVAAAAQPGGGALSAAFDDGRVLAIPIGWELSFDRGKRSVDARIGDPVGFALDPSGRPPRLHSISLDEDGRGLAAAVLDDGSLAIARREIEENLLTGETSEVVTVDRLALDRDPTVIVVDHRQQALYAGTAAGEVLWWDLRRRPEPSPDRPSAGSAVAPHGTSPTGAAVTALTLLIGGRSLVTGSADGAVAIWFPVRGSDDRLQLTRIRDLPALPGSIRFLAPSSRNKSFLAWSEKGSLGLYHSTSARRLWRGEAPAPGDGALFFAPRADGAFLAAPGALTAVTIASPHPEVTPRTLFGKVWYEGYVDPALVWQSSGGSDDFEPKLSLTPLLAGTLKGTFFSLLLAIPAGVLGAVYVSQFMHPAYQRYVKPMVEVMAALPTVVLGFLAGLWLAPMLERVLPGLAAAVLLLPPAVIAAAAIWRRLPTPIASRLLPGSEVFFFVIVLAGGLALALAASAPLEAALFGGDFRVWLEDATGLRYDQRNAIVVGLAMGFAVIPIIFAISEDALSNVPRNLVAGSLALGATRWQTVVGVVLPTASPGIFSAIMVGFGRAIGETMIVLMATGNTPIMSWSPFNGFRTLSANIAVEIPEAPIGGTLYRTLFLAALVLFALTFIVNTAAELVRQRLRERFSRL
jgi:phosphate transport system permease protein